jgi:hypothetical protein
VDWRQHFPVFAPPWRYLSPARLDNFVDNSALPQQKPCLASDSAWLLKICTKIFNKKINALRSYLCGLYELLANYWAGTQGPRFCA